MRLAIRPDMTLEALKAIARKHPTKRIRDRTLRLTADADGLTIETNFSSAFVPAQVAVAGTCMVPAKQFAALLKTFAATRPLSMEHDAERGVRLGNLLIPPALRLP